MPSGPAIVRIVDDDEALRDSLTFLLRTADLEAKSYASAAAFLDALPLKGLSCIVTDVRMPGLSGIDLLRRVKEFGIRVPVIVITGHGDFPLAVEAMRFGAVDSLEKPFDDEILLQSDRAALRKQAGAALAWLSEQRGDRRPAGDAVAARTGRAWQPDRHFRQQADRIRPRHQPTHRGDLPRQSHGPKCRREACPISSAWRLLSGCWAANETGKRVRYSVCIAGSNTA